MRDERGRSRRATRRFATMAGAAALAGCAAQPGAHWDVPDTGVIVDRDVVAMDGPAHDATADGVAPDAASDAAPGDTGADVSRADVRDVVDVVGPCTPRLVINEIQTASATNSGDEFVEIHNAANCSASLEGFTLQYTSGTGGTAGVRWTGAAGDMIAPHGYVVVGGGSYTGTSIGTFSGGAGGTLGGTSGGIGLFAPDSARIDSVGYGAGATTPLVEGSPADEPLEDESIGRIPDGMDTDDNSTDFTFTTAPSPNSANL